MKYAWYRRPVGPPELVHLPLEPGVELLFGALVEMARVEAQAADEPLGYESLQGDGHAEKGIFDLSIPLIDWQRLRTITRRAGGRQLVQERNLGNE